jgi:hypothetical protein
MVYGTPWTINAANYAYFIGLQKIIDLGHQQATTIFSGSYNMTTESCNSFYVEIL